MTKKQVYKHLNSEAQRANLTNKEFAESLDRSAAPRVGIAYAFGLITSAHTGTFNKETVCRYIRQWRNEAKKEE